jgi:hypothetical protein
VEPGFQPGGGNRAQIQACEWILAMWNNFCVFSGRQDAALHVRQDA